MNNKLRPAIIGGVMLFALVMLTTLIQQAFPPPAAAMLGCLNCLWPIASGVLVAFLYISKSPSRVAVGDGAIVGALSGIAGGLLNLVIGVPLVYVLSHARIEAQMDQLQQSGINIPPGLIGLPLFLIGGVFGLFIYTGLATVGGLIGIPLFEKRKDDGASTPPPPPMQNYGG